MIGIARRIVSQVCTGAIVVGIWLTPLVARAQLRPQRKVAAPPAEPLHAFEYGLVVFVILLGLAVVFRPSRRVDPVDEIQLPFGPKQ